MYRCMFVGRFARQGDVTQVWLYILSTSESRCGLKLCKSPKGNSFLFKFLKKLCDHCNLCYVHWLNCSHWALLIFTNRKVIYFSERSRALHKSNMALSKEYTNEQVNCFKVCYVTSESVELYLYIQLYLSAWEKLLKKNETNIVQNNNRSKIIRHFFTCIFIKDYVSESMWL